MARTRVGVLDECPEVAHRRLTGRTASVAVQVDDKWRRVSVMRALLRPDRYRMIRSPAPSWR